MEQFKQDIAEFVKKFKFDTDEMTRSHKDFRQSLLKEEFEETRQALIDLDAEEYVDGCIDMLVVSLGNLNLYGSHPKSTHLVDLHSTTLDQSFIRIASKTYKAVQSANIGKFDSEYVQQLSNLVEIIIEHLHYYNVDVVKAWNEVHRANMSKVRGCKPGRASSGADVYKPEGWVGPSHVGNHGDFAEIMG